VPAQLIGNTVGNHEAVDDIVGEIRLAVIVESVLGIEQELRKRWPGGILNPQSLVPINAHFRRT
jgi:hypothetical protein